MNWYKTSQVEEKPYRIYKIGEGKDQEIIELRYIWAYSSEQARVKAFQKMPSLREHVDHCLSARLDCDVVARLDRIKWAEVQRYQLGIKEKQEKNIQEAWWNK